MAYRIKTVSQLTGIPRPTLVAWERRYGIPEPRRSTSGYRVYSDEDVQFLRRLKAMVDDGHAISEAIGLVRARPEAPAPPAPAADELTGLRTTLVGALTSYDRLAADRLAPRLDALTFEQAIDGVYLPLLRELGDGWADGRYSVAQEHFAAAWCRERLGTLLHGLAWGPWDGPTVACGTPPDELHDIGLLALSVKLALRGARVLWLGAEVPEVDLANFLAKARPDLLCIGVTRRLAPEAIDAYARAARASAPASTRIVVGGAGVDGLSPPRGVEYEPSAAHFVEAWREPADTN